MTYRRGLLCTFVAVAAVFFVTGAFRELAAEPCTIPPNGDPTTIVELPPVGCEYLTTNDVRMLVQGLPIGTEVQLNGIHSYWQDEIRTYVGGGLVEETFGSTITLEASGLGLLEGFERTIVLERVDVETSTAARNVGAPFGTQMKRLEGAIAPGDPDFESFTLRAGTDFGLSGSGQTTINPAPGFSGVSQFQVDSFYDLEYEIEFVGAPGGPLDGLAGTSTGTLRLQAVGTPNVNGAGPCLSEPSDVAVEPSGDLVVADTNPPAVLRVDPVTGDRTIVSDAGTGVGPAFGAVLGIDTEATGDIVVTDDGLDAVLRVDPVTGDRTIVSDSGTGAGPVFVSPGGIAVEATGDLVVADFGLDAVVRVDPVTGDRTIVSDAGTGAGPALSQPSDIAVEASGDLIVNDTGLQAVLRVDPVTGDRAIVSDAGTGAGPAYSQNYGSAIEASGDIVVTNAGPGSLLRVDPVTGDRTTVSDAFNGAGPLIDQPIGVDVEASGDLVVTAIPDDALYRVDPVTGDRTVLSACPVAIAPALPSICYGTTGGDNPADLLTVDCETGVGTLVGNTGIAGVPGLAINSTGDMYATSRTFAAASADLYRIDATTGAATLIGDTGVAFMDAIAFDENDVLYGLGDIGVVQLYTVDTVTGAATAVGPTGEQLAGMAFDPTDGTLYASTGGSGAVTPDGIYTLDKTTGARTLIGTTGLGGPTPDLCFKSGNLFGVKGGGSGPNNFIAINKLTGAGTVIGPVGFSPVSGLASYREPGTCFGDAGIGGDLLAPLLGLESPVDFFGDGSTGSRPAEGPIPGPQNNDDDSATVALPFTFTLNGVVYTAAYVNNNGNLTFDGIDSSFTAVLFPNGRPRVAPFWADFDTGDPSAGIFNGEVSQEVLGGGNAIAITWENAGYYNLHGELRNTFQVLLSDGTNAAMGIGNNVCVSYDEMCWTTGDASGGAGGFGGVAAEGGIEDENQQFFKLFSVAQPEEVALLNNLTRCFDVSTCLSNDDCDDGDPCTQDACDPFAGGCSNTLAEDPSVFGDTLLVRSYCTNDSSLSCFSDADCAAGTCEKAFFSWENVITTWLAMGSFTSSTDIGAYSDNLYHDQIGAIFAFAEIGVPASDTGWWYLLRPACPEGGSWQTSPGAQPARDAALPEPPQILVYDFQASLSNNISVTGQVEVTTGDPGYVPGGTIEFQSGGVLSYLFSATDGNVTEVIDSSVIATPNPQTMTMTFSSTAFPQVEAWDFSCSNQGAPFYQFFTVQSPTNPGFEQWSGFQIFGDSFPSSGVWTAPAFRQRAGSVEIKWLLGE